MPVVLVSAAVAGIGFGSLMQRRVQGICRDVKEAAEQSRHEKMMREMHKRYFIIPLHIGQMDNRHLLSGIIDETSKLLQKICSDAPICKKEELSSKEIVYQRYRQCTKEREKAERIVRKVADLVEEMLTSPRRERRLDANRLETEWRGRFLRRISIIKGEIIVIGKDEEGYSIILNPRYDVIIDIRQLLGINDETLMQKMGLLELNAPNKKNGFFPLCNEKKENGTLKSISASPTATSSCDTSAHDTPNDREDYATQLNDSVEPITKQMGESGGKIAGIGFEMIIPPGALDEEHEIEIRRNYWKTTENEDLFNNFEDKLTLAPVVEFKPHNLVFNKPVTISLQTCYRPDPMFTSLLQIVHRDKSSERMETDADYREAKLDETGKMTFALTHFSDVKVVAEELPRRKVFHECYRLQLPYYETAWLRWLVYEDHHPHDNDINRDNILLFGPENFYLTSPNIKLAIRTEAIDANEPNLQVVPPEGVYGPDKLRAGFTLSFITELRGACDPMWCKFRFRYNIEHSNGELEEQYFPLPTLRKEEGNNINIHNSHLEGVAIAGRNTSANYMSASTNTGP